MEEEERKKKRTRRRRGKWAKVDPTQWPFDMKVAHFTDLAQGQRLKHAVEEAWLEEARRRRRNAAAGHGSQRRSTRCSSSTSTSSSDSTAAVPTSTTSTSALGSSASSESDAVSAAAEPIVQTTQANVEGDEGEVEAEVLEEEEVQVGSEYVGEVLRRSNEMKKERRKRRNAKMRREREKELSKKNERKKSEQKRNDDGSQNTKKNGDGGARKSTAAKWEETKGRVRREISKLWTTKHVKRGLVRFERHLADREVLGKECLDWKRRQCCSSAVSGAEAEGLLLPFFSHTATALGDSTTLVVVGGKDATGRGTAAVRLLDTATMEWSLPRATGPAPACLFGHAACRVGRTLYLVGGYDQNGLSSNIYRLDLESDSEVRWSICRFDAAAGEEIEGKAPFVRVGHALARYGNDLLLFGGHNGKQWSNDLYAFDIERMTWSTRPTQGVPPSPRGFHTATIVGSSLVVFGGTSLKHTFSDTHVLDLEARVWSAVIPQPGFCPPARHSHASARAGAAVFIVGGRAASGVVHDCWSFDVDTKRWTRMKENNEGVLGLSSHTLTRLGSMLVVVGGKGAATLSGDVWMASTVRLPLKAHLIDYEELELAEEVGRGSFAKVLRATLRGVPCAVKKLRKEARRDDENELKHFKQEVRLLNKLDHVNVVKMIGVCTKPRCIVTEFMAGGSLFDHLRQQQGGLLGDEPRLTSIALDIARGGRYLHQQKVIHRDIKSHNILLDEHGNAKIADLGVSRITTETATMTCVGSAQWTAPEILRHQPYDQAVDVYSYGIVLWELLSGRQPYAHLSRLEAAVAVASTQLRPEIPDHWPARWVQLMQSCWHESPQVRPTFAQVVDRIESF